MTKFLPMPHSSLFRVALQSGGGGGGGREGGREGGGLPFFGFQDVETRKIWEHIKCGHACGDLCFPDVIEGT